MPSKAQRRVKQIARSHGIILLYHSISTTVPKAVQGTLHNISPQCLEKHLQQLTDYFEFVSLEEFAGAKSKQGLAAITFDDGYKNVLQNALPVLESFKYPCCLFLNPITFEKQWNWRDKVRHLIHHDRVNEFLAVFEFRMKKGRFYRFSKNPLNNSADVDAALDEFLTHQQIDIYTDYPYLEKNNLIIDHPLISYGNHTQRHYVLASLTDDQQYREIETAAQKLNTVARLKLSDCFSAPFGGTGDINETTLKIARRLGYQYLLMSRQRLQKARTSPADLQVFDRFMPRSDDIFSDLAAIARVKKTDS